ncbi:alpha/beta hydrolase family protein [Arcticibacter eurypsychrophilus]|uniref:alpha/beta hydrolase family protein n=1 Tax=Arcticibacter eurypsychrophilus TaxID=1434752 RepID=UPI00084D0DC2|nr:alpha/beta fold hydrolase [Arcticibacter eurypsychrophilus]
MANKRVQSYVGSKQITIEDELKGISFPAIIHYPTLESPTLVAFGPYVMEVSVDSIIMEGQFPLIVISHGNGGSHLLYRTISMHLARHGYIVVMPEHYGNNRNNNTLENTEENLVLRPRHISITINVVTQMAFFQESLLLESIAVIGHSMGGYTALALAGGVPYTREGKKVDVAADPRVKALVLLAPGAGWFADNLQKVTVPILLLTAEHDPITPDWNAAVVINGVPDSSMVTFRKVDNAGHFSFLSPFPETMRNPNFQPATDPQGFDREIFHQQLQVEISIFLNAILIKTSGLKW